MCVCMMCVCRSTCQNTCYLTGSSKLFPTRMQTHLCRAQYINRGLSLLPRGEIYPQGEDYIKFNSISLDRIAVRVKIKVEVRVQVTRAQKRIQMEGKR